MEPSKPLLASLLARGDVVEVVRGVLTITPASGRPVPPEWLRDHRHQITAEAARAAGVDALEYLSYSAGKFGGGRYAGIDLQFRSMVDGSDRHGLFNAELHRDRTTKHGAKGSPLPPGQFRVRQGHKFYKLWESTGLPIPRRLSAFHDYMGKLRNLVFTGGAIEGKRVADVQPLSLSHTTLCRLLGVELPDKFRTSSGQLPDNIRTGLPDKETAQPQQPWGIEHQFSHGALSHGNKVIRGRGNKGNPTPIQEQSNDEWLSEFAGVH